MGLGQPNQIYLVAVHENDVLGVLIGGVTLRAHIDHVIVDPDMRVQRLGSRLIEEAEKRFRAFGVLRGRLTLTHANSHGPVRKFYTTLGYQQQHGEVGLEKDYH